MRCVCVLGHVGGGRSLLWQVVVFIRRSPGWDARGTTLVQRNGVISELPRRFNTVFPAAFGLDNDGPTARLFDEDVWTPTTYQDLTRLFAARCPALTQKA